jgi:hypothetical protein
MTNIHAVRAPGMDIVLVSVYGPGNISIPDRLKKTLRLGNARNTKRKGQNSCKAICSMCFEAFPRDLFFAFKVTRLWVDCN